MKVEIWSDIVCPFCYIGKRNFEKALADFGGRDRVEVVWRSFQLDPGLKKQEGQSLDQYLAEKKGVPLAEAREMNAFMTNRAKEAGLDYHLDRAILNNTFDAHRLLHLARHKGVQDQLKELLFAAYYTEGKDIGDAGTLIAIAGQAGIPAEEAREVLTGDRYADEVRQDQYEAQQVGARGVPFFVFNNKYAVSGAQPAEVFTQVLEKAGEEEKPMNLTGDAPGFCTPEGVCN